jgi:hypothetical protein
MTATEPEAVAVAVANGQRWLLSSFGSLTPGTWETVDIDFYRHHAHAWVVGVDHDGVDWQSSVELLLVAPGRWRSGAVTTTSWEGWPQIAVTRPDRAWPTGDWVLGCDVESVAGSVSSATTVHGVAAKNVATVSLQACGRQRRRCIDTPTGGFIVTLPVFGSDHEVSVRATFLDGSSALHR